MQKPIFLCFVVLFMAFTSARSQSDQEKAKELLNDAIYLMDDGDPDTAIEMLREAKKLDPGKNIYDYEIGLAYYYKKDIKKALEVYKAVVKYDDVNDQCYQMLGNMYDISGDRKKALKTYKKGLSLFPNSGRLHYEQGIILLDEKKYGEAISMFELGISKEPNYASNYYQVTKLFLNSSEKMWGLIYGEFFMNLERNTSRTVEISKLLYDTYLSQITFPTDTTSKIDLSRAIILNNPKDLESLKLPYSIVYVPTLLVSLGTVRELNLSTLNQLRTNFVNNYYAFKHHEKYPNILIEYQKYLIKMNYMEAYNYWILMMGDEEGFDQWQEDHQELWREFMNWFPENGLYIGNNNSFYRNK